MNDESTESESEAGSEGAEEGSGRPGDVGAQPREEVEGPVHPASEEGTDTDLPVRTTEEMGEGAEPPAEEDDEEEETLPAPQESSPEG